MSYKLFSFKNVDEQNDDQWATRSVEGEINSCETRTLVEIFDKFMKDKKLKILEAGCGLGGWVHYLKETGHDVIGLEYEQSVVDRVKEYDPNFPIVQGDITALEYEENTFDAYISLGVVEHFEEGPHRPLLEARRVLKPGGLAFVTVPYLSLFRRLFAHPLRSFYFFLRSLQGKEKYYWEYRYSKKELRKFLEETGFEIIYVDIDDYKRDDKNHHIGLCADFFFLRKKNGEIWELNTLGKIILRVGRLFSPWLFCSGQHMVARNVK